MFGARDTVITHVTNVFLRCYHQVFIWIITTLPITAVIMSQSQTMWEIVGGAFRILFPNKFYIRFLAAECFAGAFFVGGYWGTFSISAVFIFTVTVSNWIKLLW